MVPLLDWQVAPDWQATLEAWRAGPEGLRLQDWLAQRQAAGAVIYPVDPLRALRLTPLAQVRVVDDDLQDVPLDGRSGGKSSCARPI